VPVDHAGFVLYEAGYLPRDDWWNFPNVLSPFWRLYYNARKGHKVVFHEREVELTREHLMLIPDGQLFHCRGCTPLPTLWLAFDVARRLMPQQPIPILLPQTRTERALMCDVTHLFADDAQQQTHDHILHASMALLHVVLNRPEIRWQSNTPATVVQTLQYIERSRYKKITADVKGMERLFVELFLQAHSQPPARIVLDFDATDDPVHGDQLGRFFHGYYQEYCFLPLYLFCGDELLGAWLRPADILQALRRLGLRVPKSEPPPRIIAEGCARPPGPPVAGIVVG
jgi:hypothetical protein